MKKIGKGHYHIEGTHYEVVKAKRWNGYALRTGWKVVTPERKGQQERVHTFERLLTDVKIWIQKRKQRRVEYESNRNNE